MRKILAFFLLALPLVCIAQIQGGTRVHNHSNVSNGGANLLNTTLTNPTLVGVTITGSENINGAAGTGRALNYQTSGVNRWILQTNTTAEGGGNSGSDFQILTVTDAGAFNDTALAIARVAGGTVQFGASRPVTIGGTFSSSKACAAGFTRITPNYCAATPGNAVQTWTDATACTQRTFLNTLPADAAQVYLKIQWQALSNNAVGSRTNGVLFFPSNACTGGTQIGATTFTVQEFVATVAGTNIGGFVDHFTIGLCGVNTICATQTNAGGNGNADIFSYGAEGYFD